MVHEATGGLVAERDAQVELIFVWVLWRSEVHRFLMIVVIKFVLQIDTRGVGSVSKSALRNIELLQPNRYESGCKMFDDYSERLIVSVVHEGNCSVFKVKSVAGKGRTIYTVTINKGRHSVLSRNKLNRFEISCTCDDFQQRNLRSCKHGIYVMLVKFSK